MVTGEMAGFGESLLERFLRFNFINYARGVSLATSGAQLEYYSTHCVSNIHYLYSIANGPGTIGGTRHDPKKHGPSTARGTIISA
jgi:hypothetical protein